MEGRSEQMNGKLKKNIFMKEGNIEKERFKKRK